jgi:hypothetical protein
MIKVYKLNELGEVQTFLNGGLIGSDVSAGVGGLIGQTITFTTPSFSHTFVSAGRYNEALLLADIKSQLETASTNTLRVFSHGGRIAFVQVNPTTGVALAATDQIAKALLGFDRNSVCAGKVFAPVGPTAPYFLTAYSVNETTHVVYTVE